MIWEWLPHDYLMAAVLAGLLTGVICGIAGAFIVTMHLAFLSVCIAHAAFAGALCAVWLGFPPLALALAFSLGAAAIVGPLAEQGDLSPDASIGIIFTLMIGLAFLFFGLAPEARATSLTLFWGSILTAGGTDITVLGVTAAMCLLLVGGFFKEIQAVVCHRETAMAAGVPAAVVTYGILFGTGAVIASSLPVIGGLLVYSLLINPAAAALQLTYSLRRMIVLSASFGVASCWVGLAASYFWDLPAGASIVIVSALIFAAAAGLSPKRRRWPSWKMRATKPA